MGWMNDAIASRLITAVFFVHTVGPGLTMLGDRDAIHTRLVAILAYIANGPVPCFSFGRRSLGVAIGHAGN
jgi:hypothetical protein